MTLIPLSRTAGACRRAGDYSCPVCMMRVGATEAERRAYLPGRHLGPLDLSLLLCPECGLTLAAEIHIKDVWELTDDAPRLAPLHG